jgi:hypothetical protein
VCVIWDVTPCGFLQEPHAITSQKTAFFVVTAVKTSNLSLRFEVLTVVKIYVVLCHLCYDIFLIHILPCLPVHSNYISNYFIFRP